MKFNFPLEIKSRFDGYNKLIEFFHATEVLEVFEEMVLDFSETSFFEANLTAVLGAILNKAQDNHKRVIFSFGQKNIKTKNTFSRNGFLSRFGGEKIFDGYGTAIEYRKFKRTDIQLFHHYLNEEFFAKEEVVPKMSDKLKNEIQKSIHEIFNNAVTHGDCQNIFTCGQYYPKRKRLAFTIVDLGKSIKTNVNKYKNANYSGQDAILWAVKEGNTTKLEQIPGGLGLSLINAFIALNKGKLQIISADGGWEKNGSEERFEQFSRTFPGTIVNLEFNINNDDYYCFSSEVNENDIF